MRISNHAKKKSTSRICIITSIDGTVTKEFNLRFKKEI